MQKKKYNKVLQDTVKIISFHLWLSTNQVNISLEMNLLHVWQIQITFRSVVINQIHRKYGKAEFVLMHGYLMCVYLSSMGNTPSISDLVLKLFYFSVLKNQQPDMKIINEHCTWALHIVSRRFHVIANLKHALVSITQKDTLLDLQVNFSPLTQKTPWLLETTSRISQMIKPMQQNSQVTFNTELPKKSTSGVLVSLL